MRLADRLVEEGCGFDDPLDVDKVLASSVALSAFVSVPRFVEPLLDLAWQLDERLQTEGALDAELALPLVKAWVALGTTMRLQELDADERAAALRRALAVAALIPLEEERDALGVHLTEAVHLELVAAGAQAEAIDVLEAGLLSFAGEHELRPRLLCLAASLRVQQGKYAASWRLVQEAELAFERLAPSANEPLLAATERMLAGARCQLELACGLVDEAWHSLDRERAAAGRMADDPAARQGFLLDLSAVGFLQEVPGALASILEELDAALAQPEGFPGGEEFQATMRARRAILQLRLEQVGGEGDHARSLLEAVLEDERVDALHRTVARLLVVDIHAGAGRVARARELLADLVGERDLPDLPQEIRTGIVARRARLSLLPGAQPQEIRLRGDEARAALDAYLGSFADAPLRAGGLGFLVGSNRQLLLGVLIDLELAQHGGAAGAERGLAHVARLQSVGSLARSLGAGTGDAEPVDLARARALLPLDAGILLLVRSGPGAHVFCFDRDSILCRFMPLGYEFDVHLRELRAELARSPARDSDAQRAASARRIEEHAAWIVHQLLPPEARAELGTWKGIYVIGEDVLAGIPLECLPLGTTPIGDTHAVASLPSLQVGMLLANRQVSPPSKERFLTVAATEPAAPGLTPIPVSAQELRQLGVDSEDLLGAAATWPGLRASLTRSRPAGLHILAHGLRALEREIPVGLALAGGGGHAGSVWVEDILAASDVHLPPLVILSACGAARGPRRLGDDGLAQLAGACFARDARVVVHAANDIDLVPTLRLGSELPRACLSGTSPAEALRGARARLRTDPAYGHPFYLYSLRVVGLGLGPAGVQGR
jgi:CHAT domain-containing protein